MNIDRAEIVVNPFTKEFLLTVYNGEQKEVYLNFCENYDEWQQWTFFGLDFELNIDYDQSLSVAIYRRYKDDDCQNGYYTNYNNYINPKILFAMTDEEFRKYDVYGKIKERDEMRRLESYML